MYGPGGGGGGGRGGGRGDSNARRFTPRGEMSGGSNQRPPLIDLPPGMREMFQPNQPIECKPKFVKKKMPPYTGISQYTSLFEIDAPPKREKSLLPAERKALQREQLLKLNQDKNDLLASEWDPHGNTKATENAYNTLFVGRLSYDTNEKKLKREFEQYGSIRTVNVVYDKQGKHRGYAFIEFDREDDMSNAFKRADGKKIDGRRIVVDVER